MFVNGVVIDIDIFLVFGKYSGSIVLILNFRFVINNVNYNDGVVYWFVVLNVVGEMISNGFSFSIVGKENLIIYYFLVEIRKFKMYRFYY